MKLKLNIITNQHIHPVLSQFMVRIGLYLYTCEDFDRRVKQLQVKTKKYDIRTQEKYDDFYIRWQQIIQSYFLSIDVIIPSVRANLAKLSNNFNDLFIVKNYFKIVIHSS